MKIFTLPDLGEGLQEAEIVEWRVEPGDRVAVDQPLVRVETDKAVVDIPSPWSGRIVRRFGEPGGLVRVGAPLAEFESDEAATDAASIVGEIARAPAAAAAPQTGGRRVAAPRRPAEPEAEQARVRAAPAVRERARRLGVVLEGLVGTGPSGTLTMSDVERVAASAAGYEALRGARRTMARNMARAQAEVARATVVDEADVGDWSAAEDVTARLVRALVAGCRAEPALNAWYDARAETRRLHARIDVGLAVDTRDGLFVPVLRDAAGLDQGAVRDEVLRLHEAANRRTLLPEAMRDPTITLSNFGTLSGRFAMLMLVPPQVAILGAGRIAARVVARAERPAVRRQLPLSLTFDHRVVTGGEAARFLAAVTRDLERDD